MSDQQQGVTLGEVYRAVLRVEKEIKGVKDTVDDHDVRIAVMEDRSPGRISAAVSAVVSGLVAGLAWLGK